MKKIILLAFILLLSQCAFSTVSVYTQINKNLFLPNETITASVVLKNSSNERTSVELQSIINTTASERFNTRTSIVKTNLQPQEQKTIVIFSLTVENNFPQANYTFGSAAYINGQKLSESSTGFKIKGTPQEPVLQAVLCSDSACNNKKKVFVLGEQVFLKIISNAISQSQKAIIDLTKNASSITATTISSQSGNNLTTEQIQIGGSLLANKTYSVFASTSKTGFLPQQKEIQFAIIPQHATITNASQCNANLVCEAAKGETKKTCPQDCQ